MKMLCAVIAAFLLSGCASSSVQIENLSIPIADLQKIVMRTLPLGLRTQSVNGREYFSKYFVPAAGDFREAESERVRYHAHVYILGDRRPYKIEVYVPVEVKSQSGSYSRTKYDQGLANVIGRRIQKALYERREDRNIIDDFRVF